ncbi:MAG: hypothetical protein RBR35_09520 [Salinivirgaceae bacterium]|nr:hypothetical protein [Salinivirgaceae bacterium]
MKQNFCSVVFAEAEIKLTWNLITGEVGLICLGGVWLFWVADVILFGQMVA